MVFGLISLTVFPVESIEDLCYESAWTVEECASCLEGFN